MDLLKIENLSAGIHYIISVLDQKRDTLADESRHSKDIVRSKNGRDYKFFFYKKMMRGGCFRFAESDSFQKSAAQIILR